MRSLLICFILTATGCSGQQTTDPQTKIDTVKLFNPMGHPDKAGARDINMFKRSIAVVPQGYTMILHDKETDVETLKEIEALIISNKEEIQKDLFYILLMDSVTDFKRTLALINTLIKNQVTNYKVINIQKYFTPPEPVSIQAPTPVETITKLNDSSWFFIEVLEKGINIKLNGQETKLKNAADLDTYVASHKPGKKDILITTTKELPYDKLKAVLDVLKKHDYKKFSLSTK